MAFLSAYTPVDLGADLLAGAQTVLPWVGAGVGGGLALMFVFIGIRSGFLFFQGLVWDRRANSWTAEDEAADRAYMARADEIINAPDLKYDPDRGWY